MSRLKPLISQFPARSSQCKVPTTTVVAMCGGSYYQRAPNGSRTSYQYAGHQRGIHASVGGDPNSTKKEGSDQKAQQSGAAKIPESTSNKKPPAKKMTLKQRTMAQLDEELRQKMEGLAGDGGESGVEYEDGKPVAMKRSVKENMFRYI